MPVMVDREPLAIETLGLRTVGQVLAHVQRTNRLVINLLIDGQEPDLTEIGVLRQRPVNGHLLSIETTERRQIAFDVLNDVEQQLALAEDLKQDTIDALSANQASKAMEKLGGCFTAWKAAQESVLKTAQLLSIDLTRVQAQNGSLTEMLGGFSDQLRQIKQALEDRDFVTLCDILTYETADTTVQWRFVLDSMRRAVEKV